MPSPFQRSSHPHSQPVRTKWRRLDRRRFTQTSTVTGDIRTRITEALTTIIQTAAGKAHELSDAVTTELKIAAMTVDYPQSSHHVGDPTAWV